MAPMTVCNCQSTVCVCGGTSIVRCIPDNYWDSDDGARMMKAIDILTDMPCMCEGIKLKAMNARIVPHKCQRCRALATLRGQD